MIKNVELRTVSGLKRDVEEKGVRVTSSFVLYAECY
jgi:hypothetical protein